MGCGGDIEQKVNGVISYMPVSVAGFGPTPVIKAGEILMARRKDLEATGTFIRKNHSVNVPANTQKGPINTADVRKPHVVKVNNLYK